MPQAQWQYGCSGILRGRISLSRYMYLRFYIHVHYIRVYIQYLHAHSKYKDKHECKRQRQSRCKYKCKLKRKCSKFEHMYMCMHVCMSVCTYVYRYYIVYVCVCVSVCVCVRVWAPAFKQRMVRGSPKLLRRAETVHGSAHCHVRRRSQTQHSARLHPKASQESPAWLDWGMCVKSSRDP